MTREEQIQKAAAKYVEQGFPDIFIAGFLCGAMWSDSHPNWISVEERLPKEQGKYMFRLRNGDMYYETYYPKLKLLDDVTHWMQIVPPRKEE